MGFEPSRRAGLTLGTGLVLRALIFAACTGGAVVLFVDTQYYITTLLLAFFAVLALAEIFRFAALTDLAFAQTVDSLIAGSSSRPTNRLYRRLAEAVDRAMRALERERASANARCEYLQALCDNVPVALLTIDEKGLWQVVNRAAWKLTGSDGAQAIADRLGSDSVLTLRSLMPGRQAIIQSTETGARMLAHCSRWTSGNESRTLIALVPVDHMLDRVETQAWQDLVRMVSHEMMNSLTPITSLAENLPPMLQELTQATDSDEALREVIEAIETIRRRSNGLLNFVSRCRVIGEMPIAYLRLVSVDELIQHVLRLLAGPQPDNPVRISYMSPNSGLSLVADAELLEQALINLIRNARDAVSGVEDPQIAIHAAAVDGQISIAIVDNGVGMPPDFKSKIFVPFFSTKAGGSGIGLTLVRQIAMAHGGQIEVAANRPRGTAVTLLLPKSANVPPAGPAAGIGTHVIPPKDEPSTASK